MAQANVSLSDKIIDAIFKNKQFVYLIGILVLGFAIRFLVANNIAPLADEMIHGTNAINIISSGVINAQNQAPAWLYLTDIFYKVFGVYAFSARFASILFGSLTILVVYLIGSQIFNKKVGLIAAFLLSVSYYYIRYTLMEMDQAMMFFVLLAFYYYHKDFILKGKLPIITSALLGVAILIKPITLPYIAGFGLCTIVFLFKKKEWATLVTSNSKKILFSALILLFAMTPILAYNYILYQQKGITDVIFSRFLGINQEIYSSLQGYDKTFVLSEVFTLGVPAIIRSFLDLDPLIFILSIIGFVLIFKKPTLKSARLFVILHIPALVFLLGTSLLQTHLSTFVPVSCIAAAFAITKISEKKFFTISQKQTTLIILGVVLLSSIYFVLPNATSKSAFSQIREYASAEINPEDIVVVDSRVYRGRIAWMFNDKSYLEASSFPEFIELNNNLSGDKIKVNIYYVECVPDDCGWGTIKDQPEFNESMEEFSDFMKGQLAKEKIFYGGGGYDEQTGKPYFALYRAEMRMDPRLYTSIYDTHDWFYYPVGWIKSDWYDKYTPEGGFQVAFNSVGTLALWVSIVFAFISIVFVVKETYSVTSSQQYDKN